jgi:hypothetical protein
VVNNSTINLAGASNPVPIQPSPFGQTIPTNIFTGTGQRPLTTTNNMMIRVNTANRLQNTSFISNLNYKDKISNLYTYLKNFKDKNELNEFLKFLIDEYNYIPLKLEAENSVDVKFGRDFEWKITLNLV